MRVCVQESDIKMNAIEMQIIALWNNWISMWIDDFNSMFEV